TSSGTVSSAGNPYLFTGRELDPESGQYNYRARNYDPMQGRFVQLDPIGLQGGINLYRYCDDSPTNFADPTGQSERDPLLPEPRKSQGFEAWPIYLGPCQCCRTKLMATLESWGSFQRPTWKPKKLSDESLQVPWRVGKGDKMCQFTFRCAE